MNLTKGQKEYLIELIKDDVEMLDDFCFEADISKADINDLLLQLDEEECKNDDNMTGRGYKCCDCDCVSNLISDWIVTEDDVVCVECGSTNVEPEDIEKGVILITKADEIKRMTDDEVNEYFDELISTMPEKEFEEWASGWYEWQQEACSIAKEWDADTKREDLLSMVNKK